MRYVENDWGIWFYLTDSWIQGHPSRNLASPLNLAADALLKMDSRMKSACELRRYNDTPPLYTGPWGIWDPKEGCWLSDRVGHVIFNSNEEAHSLPSGRFHPGIEIRRYREKPFGIWDLFRNDWLRSLDGKICDFDSESIEAYEKLESSLQSREVRYIIPGKVYQAAPPLPVKTLLHLVPNKPEPGSTLRWSLRSPRGRRELLASLLYPAIDLIRYCKIDDTASEEKLREATNLLRLSERIIGRMALVGEDWESVRIRPWPNLDEARKAADVLRELRFFTNRIRKQRKKGTT